MSASAADTGPPPGPPRPDAFERAEPVMLAGKGLTGAVARWRKKCCGPWGYPAAALVAIAAFSLRYFVVDFVDPRFPMPFSTLAAMLCAALFGFWPAMLCVGVSFALPATLLAPPVGSIHVDDPVVRSMMLLISAGSVAGAWALDAVARGALDLGRAKAEILHRSKNDLATVAALLRHKARDCTDEAARAVLLEAEAVVRNAHHVQDAIAKGMSHPDDRVASAPFLGDLSRRFSFALDGIEDHRLPHTTCKSLGWVLMDLTAPGAIPGAAVVGFRRERVSIDGAAPVDMFVLRVADPGGGRRISGGGRVAHALAGMMHGKLACDRAADGRAVYVLHFPAAAGR